MNQETWSASELREYYRTGREPVRRPATSPTCCQKARPSGVSVADMEADGVGLERGVKVRSTHNNRERTYTRDCSGITPLQRVPEEPKRRKYGNEPQYVGWKKFDSKKEAAFYQQLMLRVKAGELWFVIRQVPFDLAEKERLQYFADFVAVKPDGTLEAVYDVKSEATRKSDKYVIKKKLMKELWDIEITEV